MKVAWISDEKYAFATLLSVISAIHYASSQHEYWIFVSNLSSPEFQPLQKFASRRSDVILEQVPIDSRFEGHRYIPAIGYSRILLPMQFTGALLYLDSDIVCRKSWDSIEVFNPENSSQALAAVTDPASQVYFSSGVLFLDSHKWRIQNIIPELLYLYDSEKDSLSYGDQDLLNLYFKENYLPLPKEFNECTNQVSTLAKCVHFAGPLKPWNANRLYFSYWYGRFEFAQRNRKGSFTGVLDFSLNILRALVEFCLAYRKYGYFVSTWNLVKEYCEFKLEPVPGYKVKGISLKWKKT